MSRTIRICSLAVFAFATSAGLSGTASAQDKAGPQIAQQYPMQPGPTATISDFDKQFAAEAFAGNLAEVAMGDLVKQKTRNDQVRRYGDRLRADHLAANEKLAPIASKYQIQLPSSPDSEAQATRDRLATLSGAQFDREFIQAAITDHEKDIDEYTKALGQLQNPELRAYADQTLPTLRQHLEMAQQIARTQAPVAGASQAAPQGMRQGTSQSGTAEGSAAARRTPRGNPQPPNATALLNNMSAEGYRVTSEFRRSGRDWVTTAVKDGNQVTVLYDPQTGNFRSQPR